jgi:FMN-dependent NADH-azoreductase
MAVESQAAVLPSMGKTCSWPPAGEHAVGWILEFLASIGLQSAITVFADDLHKYYSLFLELARVDKNWRKWVG